MVGRRVVADVDVLGMAHRDGGSGDVVGVVADQLGALHVVDHVDPVGAGVLDPVALQEDAVGVLDLDDAGRDVDVAVVVGVEVSFAYAEAPRLPCCACLNAEPATLTRFQSECCTVRPENVMFRAWLLVERAGDPQHGGHVVRREDRRGRHVLGAGLVVVQRPAGLVEEELARRVQELVGVHDLVAAADLGVAVVRALGDGRARLLEQGYPVRAVGLVVTWRTPTMAVVQVVAVSISMSSWLRATAGKSARLYLAPSHCEPDSHAQGACPARDVVGPVASRRVDRLRGHERPLAVDVERPQLVGAVERGLPDVAAVLGPSGHLNAAVEHRRLVRVRGVDDPVAVRAGVARPELDGAAHRVASAAKVDVDVAGHVRVDRANDVPRALHGPERRRDRSRVGVVAVGSDIVGRLGRGRGRRLACDGRQQRGSRRTPRVL